ncbi:MAG: D-alanyl-D-alanine carboxypeptidase [Spirochaetales bacterium]|nr:D-alanyl-D-alanine carboxypeptidase [Spirochaetales bacterium]
MITLPKKVSLITLIFLLTLSLSAQTLPELTAEGAVLMDYTTGRILFEKDGNTYRPPASMTKLITLYLGCEAVEKGDISLDTPIMVTETGSAFSRPEGSSLMLLEEGQHLDYLTLLQGIAVSSGNDGAYQLAEILGGNPQEFVDRMNLLVYSLGYEGMHFVDPDGWSEENRVSPVSYADFSRRYIENFPWALKQLHSVRSLTYPRDENKAPGGLIESSRTKKNTNLLLGRVDGADGLKSGYIDESGFNFAATAEREGTRLITVVMGIFTESYRDGLILRADESEALLEYGFSHWQTRPLPDFSRAVKVYSGEAEEVRLIPEERPLFTYGDEESDRLTTTWETDPWVRAPLDEGSEAGRIEWFFDGEPVGESALVTAEELKKGGLVHNFIDLFEILFYNISHGKNRGEE